MFFDMMCATSLSKRYFMKACYKRRSVIFFFIFFCTVIRAADDGHYFAAIAQWQAAEKNEQPAPLAQEALISRWDTPYHGNLRFLSNGRIALATTMPHEHIAVYEQDGRQVHVYDFGLRTASLALSRGEERFDNGCVARGYGPNENGEKSWAVEIVGPDGEKIAEHNYGPECISNVWLEHTARCPNERYLVSRRLGPMRVHTVIKDLKTSAEKILGQVGMPDFSPDGMYVAFYDHNQVSIYSCEALFADEDMADATE